MSDKAVTLLDIYKRALDAETVEALIHIIVNHTHDIVPYDHALFWTKNGDENPDIHTVSGSAILDDHSPYNTDMETIILDLLSGNSRDDGVFFNTIITWDFEGVTCGVLLQRTKKFEEAEHFILKELSTLYAHAYAYKNTKTSLFSVLGKGSQWIRKRAFYAVVVCALILCLPVRLSVTAPAEIVPSNPFIITAPIAGTIQTIDVHPGEVITQNQIVATFDNLALQSKADVLSAEVSALSQQISVHQRQSIGDASIRSKIRDLRSQLELKRLDLNYALDHLNRADVRSPVAGVAIFADKNTLQGAPVAIGDALMTVADEQDIEVLIRVPVGAMFPVEKGGDVDLHLNTAPLNGLSANIDTIGYQASVDSDGLLSYKIRASLNSGPETDIRIGWKGNATLYGERVPLAYKIFKTPLLMMRNITGL